METIVIVNTVYIFFFLLKWHTHTYTHKKALDLIEYLLTHGDERVVADVKRDSRAVKKLQSYRYIASDGHEMGDEVRVKATMVFSIIENNEKLNKLRKTSGMSYQHDYKTTRDKKTGAM